jgi:hypothetical protein
MHEPISLNTPALLFPAISLLLLAYTNRFMALATLIRKLHSRYLDNQDTLTLKQLQNLRIRVRLIRDMQAFGIASIFTCVVDMFLIFAGYNQEAKWLFGLGMVFLIISLALSLREIFMSTEALKIEISDIEVEEDFSAGKKLIKKLTGKLKSNPS